jgi:hypothetical protein
VALDMPDAIATCDSRDDPCWVAAGRKTIHIALILAVADSLPQNGVRGKISLSGCQDLPWEPVAACTGRSAPFRFFVAHPDHPATHNQTPTPTVPPPAHTDPTPFSRTPPSSSLGTMSVAPHFALFLLLIILTLTPSMPRRAHRYRAAWPTDLTTRLFRAQTEDIRVVCVYSVQQTNCHLLIRSQNGENLYDVRITSVPTCTCPDFSRRRDLCKHILFVYVACIGLAPEDPRCFQRALLPAELLGMMQMLYNNIG